MLFTLVLFLCATTSAGNKSLCDGKSKKACVGTCKWFSLTQKCIVKGAQPLVQHCSEIKDWESCVTTTTTTTATTTKKTTTARAATTPKPGAASFQITSGVYCDTAGGRGEPADYKYLYQKGSKRTAQECVDAARKEAGCGRYLTYIRSGKLVGGCYCKMKTGDDPKCSKRKGNSDYQILDRHAKPTTTTTTAKPGAASFQITSGVYCDTAGGRGEPTDYKYLYQKGSKKTAQECADAALKEAGCGRYLTYIRSGKLVGGCYCKMKTGDDPKCSKRKGNSDYQILDRHAKQ